MKQAAITTIRNGESVKMSQMASVPINRFRDHVITAIADEQRLAAFFGMRSSRSSVQLYAVLADDQNGMLNLLSTDVKDVFPSLTPDCPDVIYRGFFSFSRDQRSRLQHTLAYVSDVGNTLWFFKFAKSFVGIQYIEPLR